MTEDYYKGKYEVWKLIALTLLAVIIFVLVGSFVLALTDKPVEVKNLNTNSQSITK